jgi:hypothetical protein
LRAIRELRRWNLTEEIPDRLPILERWLEQVAQNRPLAGVTALLIQHQVGNNVRQAGALIDLGVAPRDLHWIDVPYSSSIPVRNALVGLGIPEENLAVSRFKMLNEYAPFQRLRVQRFLRKLDEDPPDCLLVLDDGAYALDALFHMQRRARRIAIVEQTTRGLIKMDENPALEAFSRDFPIVNVARSETKKNLESPFIGAAVCDALDRKFGSTLRAGPKDRCLVLGYGAIGAQVAGFVEDILQFPRSRIHVYDPEEKREREAVDKEFVKWDRNERRIRFKLVIGCSGRASFGLEDHMFLEDGAFLASATSGTVELSRERFIELADASPDDDIWIDRDGLDETKLHSDLRFHFGSREVTFVNGGFPVNFDGHVNGIPAHYIQPTPTMMCAGAVQAVRTPRTGLVDLCPGFSRWLTGEFERELGEEASLLH